MANQQQPDYIDRLAPGYHFCPKDSEIIVYYLKRKIETGRHPECRLHEVNIYNHSPDELAERYRPCQNKWYFLTPRERKYDKGDRPNRVTSDLGSWTASQKYTVVYDDVSGLAVGKKTSLAYKTKKKGKTPWLMHEYTLTDPNLPTGSGQNGKKLTDWVVCKIYKKESGKNKRAANVQYMRNQEEENGEQNRCIDEPSPIRRRLSVNRPNEPVNVQLQETNRHSRTNAHEAQQVDSFQELFSTLPAPRIDPTYVIARDVAQSSSLDLTNTDTNSLWLSNYGASTSTSIGASAFQPSDYDTSQTMFISPSPEISRHMSQDVYGQIPQPGDYFNSFDSLDGISLEDLNTPIVPYLPTESGQDGTKETNQASNDNRTDYFQDTINQEGDNEEQNQSYDELSPTRQRLSEVNHGSNQPNEAQHVEYQEANIYSNQQSVDNIIMNSSPTNTLQEADTFHTAHSIQSPVEDNRQVFIGEEVEPSFENLESVYFQNPSISTEASAFEEPRLEEEVQPLLFENPTSVYHQNPSITTAISTGALTSYSTEPPAAAASFDYKSPTSVTSTAGFDEYARRFIMNMLDRRSRGGYVMFP